MKNFQKRKCDRKNESGNVLFYILIAVVLFAALSFVVGGMMRGGNTDMIGEEQAKLFAGEILDYARVIRQAVQDLKISNGCTDSDISFENTIVAGYTNGANTACQVFNPNGGDVRYSPPVEKWGDATEWIFMGNVAINDVGNGIDDTELTILLPNLNETICQAINDKLGLNTATNPLPGLGSLTITKFTGTFNFEDHLGTSDPQHSSEHDGKSGFCFEETDTGNVFFISVLIAR